MSDEAKREEQKMLEPGINVDGLKDLMKPFPADAIGKLPRGIAKQGPASECKECGGFHRRAAVHLDYVGHAHLTERLLEVDPAWTWTPMALDEQGLPRVTERNGMAQLWINLTVCGMTRPGVGTAPVGKEELAKELIGDALRNAAMRFGCALDLWKKDLPQHELPQQEELSAEEIERRNTNYVKQQLVEEMGKEAAIEFWERHSPNMTARDVLALALPPYDPGPGPHSI